MLSSKKGLESSYFSRFILNPPVINIKQMEEQLQYKSSKFYFKILHLRGEDINFEIVIQDQQKLKISNEEFICITSEQEFQQICLNIFENHFRKQFKNCYFFTFRATRLIKENKSNFSNENIYIPKSYSLLDKQQQISYSFLNSKYKRKQQNFIENQNKNYDQTNQSSNVNQNSQQSQVYFSRYIMKPPALDFKSFLNELIIKSEKFYQKIEHLQQELLELNITVQDLYQNKQEDQQIFKLTTLENFKEVQQNLINKKIQQNFKNCHYFAFQCTIYHNSILSSIIDNNNNNNNNNNSNNNDSNFMESFLILNKNQEEYNKLNQQKSNQYFIEQCFQFFKKVKLHRDEEQQMIDQLQEQFNMIKKNQEKDQQKDQQKSIINSSQELKSLVQQINSQCNI